MKEYMYNQNSFVIALVLFTLTAVAIERSYRYGIKSKHKNNSTYKSHVDAVLTSLLSLLALLLAFTFSIALQRYDSRSDAVVDEANAIGTTYLRSALLPSEIRNEAARIIGEYLDVRVKASSLTLDQISERGVLLNQATQLQTVLWNQAIKAAEIEPNPVTSGLYIQALNELIDAYGRRIASIDRHVPESVLFLLSIVFIVVGGISGYAQGIASQRPTFINYLSVGLFVLIVFLVIDLDHPRRGLIKVSQQSLLDLAISIDKQLPQVTQK